MPAQVPQAAAALAACVVCRADGRKQANIVTALAQSPAQAHVFVIQEVAFVEACQFALDVHQTGFRNQFSRSDWSARAET